MQCAAAVAVYEEALEVQTRVLGPEQPDTMKTATNLATALRKHEQHIVAEALFRKTLEAQKRMLGPEHPDTLRTTRAIELLGQQKYAAAAPMFRETLGGSD